MPSEACVIVRMQIQKSKSDKPRKHKRDSRNYICWVARIDRFNQASTAVRCIASRRGAAMQSV